MKLYTCNVKGLEEVKKLVRNECTLYRWLRSPVMIAVDHTSKFKAAGKFKVDGETTTTYGVKHQKCSNTSRITDYQMNQIWGRRYRKLFLEIEKNKKAKNFSKTTRLDKPESPVESE